ncbi:MAG: aldehyde dehydrogenase family protein, partial [Phycisphaerales bacterium]|nr:aldehyde dehydrogenase family protein [Phycisphaerales bacterium]
DRLPVLKTYKLFIGGAFVRTESGRSMCRTTERGETHFCRASRKDLRNAVEAARSRLESWSNATAFLRGQILYRMAEMLEERPIESCASEAAVDRLVAWAGWADKYAQVLGCNNPVAGPYYNFTVPDPTGVVAVVCPDDEPLLSMVSLVAPVIASGNTCVVRASEAHPLAGGAFGEICATSDVPAGVVNILTGHRDELLEQIASHRGIDAIHGAHVDRRVLELGASGNMKRVVVRDVADWSDESCESPEWLEPFVEFKTIWHPSAM